MFIKVYVTSHMCDVSILGVTSLGRIRVPSYGPIQVPRGMFWLVKTPYPFPTFDARSLHAGGIDVTA